MAIQQQSQGGAVNPDLDLDENQQNPGQADQKDMNVARPGRQQRRNDEHQTDEAIDFNQASRQPS